MSDSDEDSFMATEFRELRSKFEEHVIHHRIHNKEYELRQERLDERHEQLMEAIEQTNKNVSGVVTAYSVAIGLQRFLKWLSGFAVIGVLAKFLLDHIKL